MFYEKKIMEKKIFKDFFEVEESACRKFGLIADTREPIDDGTTPDGKYWYTYSYLVKGTGKLTKVKRIKYFCLNDIWSY